MSKGEHSGKGKESTFLQEQTAEGAGDTQSSGKEELKMREEREGHISRL